MSSTLTTAELLSQSPTAPLYPRFDIAIKMTLDGKGVNGLLNGMKLAGLSGSNNSG